jgi:cyclic 2,3-diphosphoglycerate synthetase
VARGAELKLVVLIDGEHHPVAVRNALLNMPDDDIAGAVFCGGLEKVDPWRLDDTYGVPVIREEDVALGLTHAIDAWKPDAILDLTDEPVLSPEQRFRLASLAIARGVSYRGADFELHARNYARIVTKPSVRVFATGKRTGKTAVASALARHAVARGREPIIVAVGRGGPEPPRVIEARTHLDAKVLLELSDAGFHAGSDYVEDALTSGVTTIGCVRVGGGLAGATVYSNVHEAARMAEDRPEDLVIFEGSGASFPDVDVRAGIVCVPASVDPSYVTGFLGPARLLLADLAVVTMAEEGSAAATTQDLIRGTVPGIDVISVIFRPEPLQPVAGQRAFFCCTAPASAGSVLKEHLERVHGCEVVGMTHRLSDRRALREELEAAPDYDVLLTELKAGAVDVAVREGVARGTDVVFVNNVLVGKGIEEAFDRVLEVAAHPR